ncbi:MULTISPECIES: SDR family NAD(P)-dependent oxidoreductase [Nonomuraea]|uniref:SDR family NAD(P)-dependent oxidoreductase n=1 Tax=Nonomuraea mangrovi TaxID=2316207 RepID=A0ABW4SXI4_9ACTN
MRFSGKVVLVTGGGSGIGRASAQAFADEGATVVVAGRSAGPLERTVELITESGGTAGHVRADVANAADAEAMVAEVVARYGRLDIAFNNAGVFAGGAVTDLDEQAWARVMDVNVTGVWLSMKYEIEHMRRNGGGVIVNTASNLGAHKRYSGMAAYITSKAAVSALTKAAALEYIGEGVRINAVSPGPAETTMSLRPGESEADRDERMKSALPLGRVGRLEEIAGAVLYLASAEAGFAVGTDLVVDGGASA